MARVTRVASIEAHRKLNEARHEARRRDQGEATVAAAYLQLERDIRALDQAIHEFEDVIARMPDDIGVKPGQREFRLGPWSLKFVVSGKPQLRELVATWRTRRAELLNGEGARRITAAEALRDHLRGEERPRLPQPKRATEVEEDDDSVPLPTPPSKWG